MELKIVNVSKTYSNGVQALKNVSLAIPQGMYGLLGPNGAGKSTLMRILATLQDADAGSVTLGEMDVLRDRDAVRRTLGYLPQEFGVYPNSSAEELLDHFALLKGIGERRSRSVLVEHPDTVAERIVRYAGVVGRERVIAGADCGFASFAITDELDRRIVWAKLEALGEGARRATEVLW